MMHSILRHSYPEFSYGRVFLTAQGREILEPTLGMCDFPVPPAVSPVVGYCFMPYPDGQAEAEFKRIPR
jgi:hypothetical protein